MLPADVMIESYPPPQLIKAMVDGRAAFPEDPLTRMMIRRQVGRYNIQENAQGQENAPGGSRCPAGLPRCPRCPISTPSSPA